MTTNPLLIEILATLDAGFVMRQSGLIPDDWQQTICDLRDARILMLVCRQAGKSSTAAAMGVSRMLAFPDTPVIIVCPTERQSNELLRKARAYLRNLDITTTILGDATTKIELSNGSRMLALPGKPTTIRAFGNSQLIILDEAAFIGDDVYLATEPMLASDGQMVMMSTPFGARGLFHAAWTDPTSPWRKIRVTAEQVPRRYPAHVLASKRADPLISPRQYAQEYLCEFVDTIDAVFEHELIQSAVSTDVLPLYN